MKSKYVIKTDVIQREVYKRVLKPYGFNKKGRTHNKKVEKGITQVVSFQIGGKYPDDKYMLFLRFGIRIAECANRNLNQDDIEKDNFYDYDCNIRGSNNYLQFETKLEKDIFQNDTFFNLDKQKENDIIEEICKLVKDKLIPLFDELSSREQFIDKLLFYKEDGLWIDVPLLQLALLHGTKGDIKKAEELLIEHYIKCDHKGHKEYLKDLAQRLNLELMS